MRPKGADKENPGLKRHTSFSSRAENRIVNYDEPYHGNIYPLLGNGSVNTFPQHKRSTIGHPLLGN
jgi:hypothetical protein